MTGAWWERLLDNQAPRIVEGHLTVRMGRYSDFAIVLTPSDETHRNADGLLTVRLDVVNVRTSKRRFGFYIHPWWLRVFVFDLAQAVATIEREFETLPDEFVEKMRQEEATR